ncbi:T9SS type A sorting domain-containing protein [Flavobacterium tegetincola]
MLISRVSDVQINVNSLASGMYLINITSGDKSITKKFLKQ